MQNVILAIHILACLVMIGLVLVQKSEGGGLGMGGGGGGNSLLSGRGAAGAVVRSTIIFGGIFFLTSLALTSIASRSTAGQSAIDRALGEAEGSVPVQNGPADLFDPSVPLLSGQTGIEDGTEAVVPAVPAETGTEPDPAASEAETTPPADDTAPDAGNPQ